MTKRNSWIFSLAVVVPIMGVVFYAIGSNSAQPSKVTMAHDMLGCRHTKTYHYILEMVADNVKQMGAHIIDAEVASGECIELQSGLVIIPQANITLNGVVLEKVRPKGQITEYWTLATAISD